MKSFLLSIFAIILVSVHATAGEPRPVEIKFQDHPRCALSKDEQRVLEKLKVGMTRKQLEKNFDENGGLIDSFRGHYLVHAPRPWWRRRGCVGVVIVFKPAAMSEATFANPQQCNAWLRKHSLSSWKADDVVRAFSKPYKTYYAID